MLNQFVIAYHLLRLEPIARPGSLPLPNAVKTKCQDNTDKSEENGHECRWRWSGLSVGIVVGMSSGRLFIVIVAAGVVGHSSRDVRHIGFGVGLNSWRRIAFDVHVTLIIVAIVAHCAHAADHLAQLVATISTDSCSNSTPSNYKSSFNI